jgi:molybdopterin-synthase adenylyltransferase
MLRFKPYIQVNLNEKNKEVLVNRPLTDGNVGNVFKLTDVGLEIFKNIGELTRNELYKKICVKYPFSSKEVTDILEFLISENYIEDSEVDISVPSELHKFRRIMPLWAELENEKTNRYDIQTNIINTRIGVIGCGTIGATIIGNLTAMGVRNFVLVDKDIVEDSNITRQPIFSIKDIGYKKVEIMKKFINERNEYSNVEIHEIFISNITDLEIFNNVDLIISCGDEGDIDSLVNQYAINKKKIVSFAGSYTGLNCRVFPIYIPNKSHSLKCIYSYLKKELNFKGTSINNVNNKVSTVPYISDLISSIVSAEITKILLNTEPYIINKILLINISEYKIDFIEIPEKLEECNCISNQNSVSV